ncbi:MAG: hypothetical protein K9W44_05070 [Candidatus Lokiarchaeota archaeon]|nr:hypothetical protein [Candidatus Harpocratesius repetitus]
MWLIVTNLIPLPNDLKDNPSEPTASTLEHRARKIEPLINGKYEEFIFARITLFEEKLTHCTADWQRHNLKWYTVHEGTLEDCLKYIENDFGPFGYPFDYKVMN